METLHEINKLRNKTKTLIKQLYDAAKDNETFESTLLPVITVPEPERPKPKPKEYKFPKVKIQPEPKRVITRRKVKKREVIEPEYDLKELQEFRKLYPNDYITIPEIKLPQRKPIVNREKEIPQIENTIEYTEGYFTVTSNLKIQKSVNPILVPQSEQIKVSIPKGTIIPLKKHIRINTKSTFDPQDSIDIQDVRLN
ncbi:hypothetical protein HK103_005688 [Boothiomyces macroporosus]|uniref:Uncharacterized protein n=1 Tax=Boothiomyces macroporosus TaxID=261099 RepID=A0AAD5Y7L5_9FUNG|nr:hypothetical protein HK103_005688 [Boothiomyces macroporosus]